MVSQQAFNLNKDELIASIGAGKQSGKFKLEKTNSSPNSGLSQNSFPSFSEPNTEEVSQGLVPLSDTGLWITPTSPISPDDCDNWPNSPLCGGTPISPDLLDLGVAIVQDECNLGVSFSPVVGFINLPTFQIVWKDMSNPNCVPPEPPFAPPLPPADFPDIAMPPSGAGCGIYRSAMQYYNPRLGGSFYTHSVITAQSIDSVQFFSLDADAFGTESEPIVVREVFWKVYYTDCFGSKALWGPTAINGISCISSMGNSGVIWEKVGDCVCSSPPNFNPPLPAPQEPCCMTCCDDSLLQLLLEKVEKLSEVVGVDEYPANLPASLITKIEVNNDKLGQTIEPSNIEMPSLTRLVSWFIERVDELFGQWEIPIEIKDTDATKPGDQPKGIVLPNLAEYAGESFLMQYSMLVNMEALISMCTRTLLEAGQLKQQGYIAYQSIQAVIDYLGFKVVDKKTQLPLTFTPGKQDLAELLQDSTINVIVPEFGDKVGLVADLHRFKKACGIVEAQGWRKIDLNGDVLGQVMGGIFRSRKILADMLEQEEDNWDNFKDQTEAGYSGEALHPTPNKPYGKPYDQRPKIKELGTIAAAEEIENLPVPPSTP